MKIRIYTYTLIFFILLELVSGCRKELSELYNDPDQTVNPSIPELFTEMLDNDRIRPSYWNVRTFLVMHAGIYTQSVGYLNIPSVYQQNPSYTEDYWNDFYISGPNGGGVMVHFRSIEEAYDGMTNATDKQEMAVFVEAARAMMLDQASQMVDLWGDIPYSEAGYINSGTESLAPKFDHDVDVYGEILNQLKTTSTFFASVTLSPSAQANFKKQDILLQGNLDLWRRYVNSLRLRLLMRISYYDENRARTEVLEMLNDPLTYPLVDGASGYQPASTDILLQPLVTYKENLRNAFTELNNDPAPGYMLNEVMKPADDPRIPVMFDKYGRTVNDVFVPNSDYIGMPADMNSEDQQKNLGLFAIRDSATFQFNTKLPGIVLTAAEVNFLKAEAFERWGGGDAQTAYETAIRQSVTFYYYLNSLNTVTAAPLPMPDNAVLDAFLQKPSIQYAGSSQEKLIRIWTQKWLHFDILQSNQSWAEYRRTKYPQLSFYTTSLSGYEQPPNRLVYPSSESAYNPNYASVKNKDLRENRVFWDVK